MAYKFQLGAAVLSGSAKFEDGLVATDVDDTTAANIVAEIDNGEIPIAKLSATTISGVSLGSNLNSLSKATNGGVNFSSYNGSAAVNNLQLDINDLAAADVSVANDFVAIYDADADSTAKESISDIITAVAGNGLAASSGVLAVGVDDSTVEINSDALRLKDGGITNAKINGGAAIGHGKLADITAGQILMGNASNVPTATAISGDIALANNGAVTIQANAVEGSMINSNAAGDGLGYSSNALNVDAAQTVITSVKNDALVVGRSSGNDHIDFSSAGTVAIETDNTARLSITDATSTFSNNLVVAGNLTVQGASVEVQQGFVVTSSVQFEGSTPDGNEISLTSADPSADRTITLPDLSGHVPLLAGAIGNANVTAAEFLLLDGGSSVGTTALADADGFMHNDDGTMKQTQVIKIAELAFSKISGDATVASNGALTIESSAVEASMLNNNIVSGLDDIGAAIADTDEMIISDAGTIKRMDMSRIKTYIGAGTVDVTNFGDADATLAKGINVATANTSAARTLTLPASAGLSAGDSVKVKVAGVSSGNVTIARAGSQTIDGSLTSITLESDNAAVELIYVGTDDWRIF